MPLSCSAISSSLVCVSALCCSIPFIAAEICAWTAVGGLLLGARSTPESGVPAEGWGLRWRSEPTTNRDRTDGSSRNRGGSTTSDTKLLCPRYVSSLITDTRLKYKRRNEEDSQRGKVFCSPPLSPLFFPPTYPHSCRWFLLAGLLAGHARPCPAGDCVERPWAVFLGWATT